MTALFARKEKRRRMLASLPIEEKMEIAQRLQEIGRTAPGRHLMTKPQRVKITAMRQQVRKKRVA